MGIQDYSKTPANNNSPVPNGWPEGMPPSGVNDSARQNMADLRTWYEDSQWVNLGAAIVYSSANAFTLPLGVDLTATYHVGRRVKAVGTTTGTITGTITDSAYTSLTTVTVSWDSTGLQNEALIIYIAALSKVNDSIPYLNKKSADVASASTIDLNKIRGDLIDVTGTTAITAITLAEGQERTVRFTGILTLTNGASLILPSAANIDTAAGDFAIFRGYASSVVRCVAYSKANGKAIITTTSPSDLPQATTTARGASILPKIITIANNAGDANHDIDFSAGVMQFSDGSGQAAVSALTKRGDATWALGNSSGGMASGITLLSNTWYYCFALSKADGSVTDFGFDNALNASNLLADANVTANLLTKAKYLGAIRTDGSGNILAFTQTLNIFTLKVSVLDVNAVNQLTTETLRTITSPLGINAEAFGSMYVGTTSAGYINIKAYSASMVMSALTARNGQLLSVNGVNNQNGSWRAITNTSSQIKTNGEGDTGSSSFSLFTDGWVDLSL